MDAWKEKKKSDLKPYTDPNDKRLKVLLHDNKHYTCLYLHEQRLEGEFLQYWRDWEESITQMFPKIAPSDKERMQISKETLEGLTMTGK